MGVNGGLADVRQWAYPKRKASNLRQSWGRRARTLGKA